MHFPAPLRTFQETMLPAVEEAMQAIVERAHCQADDGLYHMLAYHLGWQGEGAGPAAQGKRVRPLLLLLTTAATGGQWRRAVPAAAAVELLHNFSLIHDDIEDRGDTRRGRPTVWKRWGLPLGLNSGDALFTLASIAVLELHPPTDAAITLQAARILHQTALHLTKGQHLDIAYENRPTVSVAAYWQMVEGKTAALLAACTELGALLAGASDARRRAYHEFGRMVGLAFQAWDDYLGIWGDAALTGKSTTGDLMERKKTLPVLYGLEQGGAFARAWANGSPRTPEEVPALAAALEADGARAYTEATAASLTGEALQALDKANPQGPAGEALRQLALLLLKRAS